MQVVEAADAAIPSHPTEDRSLRGLVRYFAKLGAARVTMLGREPG